MLVLKVVLRPHLKPISSGPVVDVIKLFLEEISISPKLRNWKTFVLMSEPAQKCENNAILIKTMLKNCLLLLKWPILAVLA